MRSRSCCPAATRSRCSCRRWAKRGRQIDIGPSKANAGRITLDLNLRESDFSLTDTLQQRHAVTTAQLAIPEKALREYQDAQKDLARHDSDAAVKRLEAYQYNLHAVRMRPNDPLANSQLGMTYFELGKPELAEKYFETARSLDPGHFSHPQLFLAEIHLRRGDRKAAAADLEDLLKHHPDWHASEKMRSTIAELRQ